MYILYNILILIVLVIFIVPYYTYRLFTEKGFALRFKQSLGCVDEEDIAKVAGKDCVWIHGASVGEIVATSPLVKQIRKEMPEFIICNIPIPLLSVPAPDRYPRFFRNFFCCLGR